MSFLRLLFALFLPLSVFSQEFEVKSSQEYFSDIKDLYGKKEWSELILLQDEMLRKHEGSSFVSESYYYSGMARLAIGLASQGNSDLTLYLQGSTTPKFFEETIVKKFELASDKKLHNLSKEEKLKIYEEVIAAIPMEEMGTKALYEKGNLQYALGKYKEAVESFEMLIKRFPQHSLAIESHLLIVDAYYAAAKKLFPDPNFLDLARISIEDFSAHFPTEERICLAKNTLLKMEEFYAKQLFDTALFYQRTKKPDAAQLYFKQIVNKYPSTETAKLSKERILTPTDTITKEK